MRKIADERDVPGVRRPHDETPAILRLFARLVGPEHLPRVVPLAGEKALEDRVGTFGQHRRQSVAGARVPV